MTAKDNRAGAPAGKDRRGFLQAATIGAAAAGAASAFPAPAIAKGRMEWGLVTTWPKRFPGFGAGSELLADIITKSSDGRLVVNVYGANELVPALGALDAVNSGVIEMGHGAPYYWKDKVPASQFIASQPFGLTAEEMNAWFHFGGGQALADEVYRELGCKFFPAGNTGMQMGGWFTKQMKGARAYRGLAMRVPGLGGAVVKAAGAEVLELPGDEISAAFESGRITAASWSGPYGDLALGLQKHAKFCYYPGWQEPATCLDNFINIKAWEKLPDDLKALVEAANAAVNQMVLSELTARNHAALATLVDKHGVAVKKFPDALLKQVGKLSGQVMNELASRDKLSRKVLDAILTFRRDAVSWTKVSTRAFHAARALPFPYAKPSKK